MDAHINHAHMRIRICIENDQNMSECVPGSQTTNALSRNKVIAQPQNDYVHIIEQSKSITHGKQVDQSINPS